MYQTPNDGHNPLFDEWDEQGSNRRQHGNSSKSSFVSASIA